MIATKIPEKMKTETEGKPFLDLSQQAMVDGSSKSASEGWPPQEKAEG